MSLKSTEEAKRYTDKEDHKHAYTVSDVSSISLGPILKCTFCDLVNQAALTQ